MIINPTKKSLNLQAVQARASRASSDEKFRAAVPGASDKFSEEFFIPFEVVHNSAPIKLCTYREKAQNISNPDQPRALIFFMHGLFAHINRYAHLAKFFSKMGLTVVGFDARGHGKSGGLPGYIENLDYLISDFEQFIELVDKTYSKKIPRFFLGQSMGGLIGFLIGVRHPEYFTGMALLAPSLKPHPSKHFLMKTAKFLSYVTATLPIPTKPRNESSKNPAVFENVVQEPLIYEEG